MYVYERERKGRRGKEGEEGERDGERKENIYGTGEIEGKVLS